MAALEYPPIYAADDAGIVPLPLIPILAYDSFLFAEKRPLFCRADGQVTELPSGNMLVGP